VSLMTATKGVLKANMEEERRIDGLDEQGGLERALISVG
jgi:hypothetical protein